MGHHSRDAAALPFSALDGSDSTCHPIVVPPHDRLGIAPTRLAGMSAAIVFHRAQSVHFADPTTRAAGRARLGQQLNELRALGRRLLHHGKSHNAAGKEKPRAVLGRAGGAILRWS